MVEEEEEKKFLTGAKTLPRRDHDDDYVIKIFGVRPHAEKENSKFRVRTSEYYSSDYCFMFIRGGESLYSGVSRLFFKL